METITRTCTAKHLLTDDCLPCTARRLALESLESVEWMYDHYLIDQHAMSAYRYVWVTSAHRYGDYAGWDAYPQHPRAQAYVTALHQHVPSGRGAA